VTPSVRISVCPSFFVGIPFEHVVCPVTRGFSEQQLRASLELEFEIVQETGCFKIFLVCSGRGFFMLDPYLSKASKPKIVPEDLIAADSLPTIRLPGTVSPHSRALEKALGSRWSQNQKGEWLPPFQRHLLCPFSCTSTDTYLYRSRYQYLYRYTRTVPGTGRLDLHTYRYARGYI
jgi:hypothetical protein